MGKKFNKHRPPKNSSTKWDDPGIFDDDEYQDSLGLKGLEPEEEMFEDEYTSFDYERAAEEMTRWRPDRDRRN